MGQKVRNRLELRRAAQTAEDLEKEEKAAEPSEAPRKAKKVAKPRAPRATSKTKAPVRMRIRWGVFNDNMKQVAVFDYPHRAQADEKADEMMRNQKGHHFVLAIREPMEKEAAASS
jgi:hypothetical protein